MQVVILCGGSGTRLWPVSRTLFPKQFVRLFENESLYQKTISRNVSYADSFSIVVNQDQFFMAQDQLDELKTGRPTSYLLEPVGRNTAPAIALAAMATSLDEVMLVVPSDHLIDADKKYSDAIARAKELAMAGGLVTFGIRPTYPETGYGYIEANGNEVLSFKEKPDSETARHYIGLKNFFWNSGMFCFRAGTFLEELKAHAPDIYAQSRTAYENAKRDLAIRVSVKDMEAIRSESIDYAVMEKSKRVKIVPAEFTWNDLGSFDSLYSALPKDKDGNTLSEQVIHIGSKNNLILGGKRLITTIDVEDLMIADTADALMVAKKGSTQKVKDLVAQVKKVSPEMTNVHTLAHRPWGTYTVLEDSAGYKVKQIKVKSGAKLSLQYHHHRSEHWIVVSGTATVTIGEETSELYANQSTYIPKGTAHRLANMHKEDLIIIEAQVGTYLGEDDIVRLQDDYKRN